LRAVVESVRALIAAEQVDQAIALLEPVAGATAVPAELSAELAACLLAAGRPEEAERHATAAGASWTAECWLHLFRVGLRRDVQERVWPWLDRALPAATSRAPLGEILEGLCALDARTHAPALERWLGWQAAHARPADLPAALGDLARACAAGGLEEQAAAIEARRASVAEDLERRRGGRPARQPEPASMPFEVEAPAVPLSRADQEFVSGRLTGAELVQGYDLPQKALEQVEEVTARFPGHLGAQGQRVQLLREADAPPAALADALTRFALALRAGGRHDDARAAAEEAVALGSLSAEALQALERAGLTGGAPGAPACAKASRAPETAVVVPGGGTIVDLGPAAAPDPPSGQSSRRTRTPGSDIIAEVRALIAKGSNEEALRRIEALRQLGYASPDLDVLAKAGRRPARPAAAAPRVEVTVGFDDGPEAEEPAPSAAIPAAGAADDLGSIAAALDGVLFDEVQVPVAPETDEERSLDEVVASFRSQVAQQVEQEDHRTHYDLGIAYKGMGLVDEAIEAFLLASRSTGLRAEACNMLALCHRERGEIADAVRWYREALGGVDGRGIRCDLRYDLAEALLEAGDAEAALVEFRDLLRADPTFRDVSARVADLERQSTCP
jgi:tetratricopeptide (TPR) repeat protein